MAISLCVLRLEVADDCSIPDIADCAGNPKETVRKPARSMSSDSTSHATAGQSTKGAEAVPLKQVIQTHRGKREIHEIVLETHMPTDSATGESPHQSKEPSPALSESGDKKMRPTSQINFFSGNPFVEVTKGILHLYKENHMTSLAVDAPRSEMICILAIPAAMTSHDLLQFVAPLWEVISHVRIIRDSTPNQYMVLIKFRNQTSADEFYKTYNGTRFNSIEPEVCHLVYIARVETTKEFDAGCLPLEGHTELPTCPVCLERMDESVDGILTILCNHSFHGSCLDKWGDTSCPVCRYCQTPEVVADNRCSECHVQESLWICLICGHVGCGRYVEGHAYNHFIETQHTYAMQLGNNRVWDYAGDNYVHRLIQNKGDGKLVEFNERTNISVEQEEKLDSMQLEYTYLLTSQLESQRLYFEDKITRIEKESLRQIDDLKDRTKTVAEEYSKLKKQLEAVTKEKTSQEKRVQQLTGKLQKVATELQEEKQISECLRQNQTQWQSRVKDLDDSLKKTKDEREQEVYDLKEQLRDVMFYLEAQQTLQNTNEVSRQEIEESKIVVGSGETASSSGSSSAASKSRRKKHK